MRNYSTLPYANQGFFMNNELQSGFAAFCLSGVKGWYFTQKYAILYINSNASVNISYFFDGIIQFAIIF